MGRDKEAACDRQMDRNKIIQLHTYYHNLVMTGEKETKRQRERELRTDGQIDRMKDDQVCA